MASGKVRAVGASNFRPWDWDLLLSAMAIPLIANQIEISIAEPRAFTDGDLSCHLSHVHPVMTRLPLGGGALCPA